MNKFLAVGLTLASLVSATPVGFARADADSASTEGHHPWREARAAIFDAKLVGFKASLALTADQEKNWSGFEAALRDIAKARREDRHHDDGQSDDDARPSPIDRALRMSDKLSKRSAELKQFADAAQPLYASLDDKQKLVFGAMVRELNGKGHHWRRHHDD